MSTPIRKVLVADDDPDILEILRYNLVQEGYDVITAKDGDDALEKARKQQPDLIVLDVMIVNNYQSDRLFAKKVTILVQTILIHRQLQMQF